MKRHLFLILVVVVGIAVAAWVYVPEFRDGIKLLLGDVTAKLH